MDEYPANVVIGQKCYSLTLWDTAGQEDCKYATNYLNNKYQLDRSKMNILSILDDRLRPLAYPNVIKKNS